MKGKASLEVETIRHAWTGEQYISFKREREREGEREREKEKERARAIKLQLRENGEGKMDREVG